MKTSFNTYELFEEDKIKLGKDSANFITEKALLEIASSIDTSNGGAKIFFEALTDENFAELTASFENAEKYGKESYIIKISDDITVYYTSEITKIYALYTIKRMYTRDGIKKGIIYNTPVVEFRCIHCNLPAKNGIEEFKRLIDFLLAFGHNAIMIEIGGAMEYKRHPEISEGWVEYCNLFKEFNGANLWAQRSAWYPKNSIHLENGCGEYLTYEELSEIVEYCRERHFEIIPEVPSLSHADYILYNHPEFSELDNDHLPCNACPKNEDYYKVVFDILDEVCEVFKPRCINICHDEAYVFGYCPKCRGENPGLLFATHITRLHDHLQNLGVKTMIWGDGIMPADHCGNAGFHRRFPWDGERTINIKGKEYKVYNHKYYSIPEYEALLKEDSTVTGLYTPPKKNSINLIPRDVMIMDWSSGLLDACDLMREYGFYHVYGNFGAFMKKGLRENVKRGIKGMSFSNWGKVDFEALQRTNTLFAIGYNCLAAWSGKYDDDALFDNTFDSAEAVYNHINYDKISTKHLKLIHTTDAVIDHPFFHCGFSIVKEDYRIGDYEIKYTDGSVDTLPIYWGQNIGNSNVLWDKNAQLMADMDEGFVTQYIYEPIGESKPVFIEGKTYYEISVPVTKDVESVTLKAKDGYNIELKSYEYEN